MLKARKLLVLVHRYLGTALCLLFFMWFLTGIGMIYSRGMPRLTAQARLARLPVLDMERIQLRPRIPLLAEEGNGRNPNSWIVPAETPA